MTQENRRHTYRTLRPELRSGTLRYGRKRIFVEILNESAGGFCVSTAESCDLVSETEAQLTLDDGDAWRVKVKYVDLCELSIRIGLERIAPQATDRRNGKSGTLRPFSSLGALTITASVFLGYVIGNNLPLRPWSRPEKGQAAISQPVRAPLAIPPSNGAATGVAAP